MAGPSAGKRKLNPGLLYYPSLDLILPFPKQVKRPATMMFFGD
jgi:hypothetical protein